MRPSLTAPSDLIRRAPGRVAISGRLMTSPRDFLPLPADEPLTLAWPTPNQRLFAAPARFFAATRANPAYGQPGWTRDCGRRLHRGADIAPIRVTPTGQTTRVIFTDCATGQDYPSDEPTFIPHDDVFCVCAGVAVEVIADESVSDFGKHVVIAHRWPRSGGVFRTVAAHLATVTVEVGAPVRAGQTLGVMGQTSRSPDARNWLALAPHLHFEVRDAADTPYDPAEFLRRYLPRPAN